MTNGTTVSQATTTSSKSILPSNVTDTEMDVVTGQLTGTIMGLLPSLLENQTDAEKTDIQKSVKKEVERFFGELITGGGDRREGNESEKKREESSKTTKDECTGRPCNPKAVCIAIGVNPSLIISPNIDFFRALPENGGGALPEFVDPFFHHIFPYILTSISCYVILFGHF